MLDAVIHELSMKRSQHTYFLGPFGMLLWALAFPSGNLKTQLNVTLSVSDSLSRSVYKGTLAGHRTRLRGLYFNADWCQVFVGDLDDLLRWGWRGFFPDLEIFLKKGR